MRKKNLVNCILNIFLRSVVILVTLSCTRAPREKNTVAKWIRIATEDSPSPTDWNFCNSVTCFQNAQLVMEGLARYSTTEDETKLVPSLAESWTIEDNHRLIIKLKKNIHWTNHETLVSQDFVAAWKRVLSSKNELAASHLFKIQNARAYFLGKLPFEKVGIETPSSELISLRLTQNPDSFIANLTHPSTWPISHLTGDHSVTLGRFLPPQVKEGDSIRYLRNSRYYGIAPDYEGVVWKTISNARQRVNQYQDKEVDIALQVPLEYWRLGQGDLNFKSGYRTQALYFNINKRPFHLASLRTAFVQAIDRQEWKDLIKLPLGLKTEALGYIASEVIPPLPKTNVTDAQAMLAKYHLEDRNQRYLESETQQYYQKLSLAYLNEENAEQVALNLQAQWIKTLNVKVELVPVASSEQLKTLSPPPSMVMQPMTPNAVDNLLPWDIHTARLPEESKEWTFYPLYNEGQIILQSRKIKALYASPLGGWELGSVWLEG